MQNNEKQPEIKPGTKLDSSQTSSARQSLKRGAFPTPKAEIESAIPFIPQPDETKEDQTTKSYSPAGDHTV